VVDVVAALTDSPTPRQYWGKIKQREFLALQLPPHLGTTEIGIPGWQKVCN